MSRRVAIAILPALLLLAAAAPAGAGTTKAATTVEIEQLFAADPFAAIAGSVVAGDPRCVGGRQVAITVIDKDGKPIGFDVAKTGKSGGWTGIHDLLTIQSRAPLKAVRVKVRKRKIAISKNKTLICQGDRVSVALV